MVFVMIKIYMFFMEGEDKYCRMADMGVSRTKWGIAGKTIFFLIQLLVFSWVLKAELQPS